MATSTIARMFPHRWALERMPYTKPSPFRDGDIDGELYSERYTRGNVLGHCKDCGIRRMFHPFTGGLSLTSSYAPVSAPMMGMAEAQPATLA